MEIENTLESAVRIVRGIGEFTQESTTIFETLRNTKEYFQEVLRYNLEDRLIQNLCYSVLCGGFILIKCCYANLKKTIQEMEKEELPERLKPKVREIRSYCTSLEKKLQEIEATVTDINTTIKNSRPRGYQLKPEEKLELEMLMGDFRTDLRIAENYQNEVDRVLKSLQSELRNYLIKEGLLVVAASAAIGAATGGAGGAACEYLKASFTAEAASAAAMQDAAVIGASIVAVISAVKAAYSINSLIIGASVASLYLFFSLKGWFDKRELYNKLSLIIRNYSEMANEYQDIFKVTG